ncbi:hypothetical protein CASFOL_022758 [Castilleja foliolosa]|uniref:Uncharacterized protein n=1 Tax=Castilleja foliolosa TaxID=1961234 RepID=A0ABD3CTA6_9LAMI
MRLIVVLYDRRRMNGGPDSLEIGLWRRLKLGSGGSILEPAKHEYKLRMCVFLCDWVNGNPDLGWKLGAGLILLTPLVMIGFGKHSSRADGDVVFRQPTVACIVPAAKDDVELGGAAVKAEA